MALAQLDAAHFHFLGHELCANCPLYQYHHPAAQEKPRIVRDESKKTFLPITKI